MSMTENPPIAESTSSPSSQQNVNSKKKKSSQNELETLKTKYDVCKQRLQQSEHRLQQADNKVIQLQAQKEMLEEKLERFKVEVENRELKSKEKNANPSDEMIKRKFEELFAAKSEQTVQQFRQNIQEELGKNKRKLHEDYEQALNDSKQSLSNEEQKQIRLMTKRIADLEEKVGEENASGPSAKRVRFEDEGDATKFKDMLKQRQLNFEDHMLKQYQDFKSTHQEQQVATNLSGGNGQTLIDAPPPPTTKKMASQDNSEEECSVNIQALVEAHQKRLEEIGKQLEGVATREELGQLRKEIVEKDDFAKLRPILQSLAKTCQNTSEKHKALEENHLELKRLMEQKINSLKDWTFLDGWLENVTLVRVSGNYFELDHKNVGILRAKKPFPIVATGLPGRRLYYFEVHFHTRQITAMMHVGLMKATGACMDFAANNNGSFYILGSSDNNIPSRQGGFSCNDVVGCGLLILDEKRHIFFTRNGKLWAKPFPLASIQLDQDLYTGVIASTGQQPALTPNFGDKPIFPFQFMDANCPKVIDF